MYLLRKQILLARAFFWDQSVNSAYGSYEDGPKYNSAVDYNQRYGEEVTNWEGAVVTDINQDYQTVSPWNLYFTGFWSVFGSVFGLNIGNCDRYQLYGGGKEGDQSEISEIICSQAAPARTALRSNDDRSGSAVKGNLEQKLLLSSRNQDFCRP